MSESVGNPIGLVWLRAAVALAILLLGLVACIGGDSGSERATEPEFLPSATGAAPTIAGGTGTFTPVDPSSTPFMRPTSVIRPTVTPIPEAVTTVIGRLAAELELNRSDIELIGFEPATWPSTALGCPVPGRSYAQIVTSGYRVALRILDAQTVYHVDESGMAMVECEGGPLGR